MATVQINTSAAKQWGRQLVLGRLERTGEAVAQEARNLAPVDTGRLRSEIRTEMALDEMAIYVIAGTWYAIFVEFGTRLWAGHPFLRPALAAAARLWGGHYVVSVHAAAVVSEAHGETAPRQPKHLGAVSIPGTLAPHVVNQQQVQIRKKRNRRLAAQLPGVTIHYHGKAHTARTVQIPHGALPFRKHRSAGRIHWEAD